MLILSRKKDESIVIHGVVEVMVLAIIDDKVRLGIKAPREITVHRKEVQDALDRDREQEAGR